MEANHLVEMGAMCRTHSDPLLFPIQLYGYEGLDLPALIPWELVRAHDQQARRNHSQSLARLAERYGLSPKELLAVVESKPYWSDVDRLTKDQVVARLRNHFQLP